MKLGSTVTLTYTGKLEDGTVFGFANEESPMVFQTGMELTIEGFEAEILEMEEGEKKTFTVGQYQAYGEYHEHLVQDVARENVPLDNLEVGQRVWMLDEEGERMPVTVVGFKDNDIIFDLNHPLAGKDLIFEVEIKHVEDAPEDFVSAKDRRAEEQRLQAMLGGGNPDDMGGVTML